MADATPTKKKKADPLKRRPQRAADVDDLTDEEFDQQEQSERRTQSAVDILKAVRTRGVWWPGE